MSYRPLTLVGHPPIVFAPADGRGSGDGPGKRTATERAFQSLERAIDTDSKRRQRLESERRKAVGATFADWIENVDHDLRVEIFAGLEVSATKANRNRIASYEDRPDEVDDIVEQRLAEIEAAKLEAKRKPDGSTSNA